MVVKVSTSELLLDSLIDNPNIQAALLVDERGYIIEKRGHSLAIRDDDATETGLKKAGLSNVYIVKAGDDYLVVVFDERLNFERLKQSVDATLQQFDIRTT